MQNYDGRKGAGADWNAMIFFDRFACGLELTLRPSRTRPRCN